MDFSLPATTFFMIGPMPITDGFLGAILVSLTMILVFTLSVRKFALVPTRVQFVLEAIVEYIYSLLINAFKDESRARAFLPFFVTLLLFLVFANQITLAPFLFEITFGGQDLFRQPTSDLVQPLALSLLIFVLSNYMAIKISPIKHLSNFINVQPLLRARTPMQAFEGVINFFIGILNIIGELAKVVSLACRLFGNIFAGNLMAVVIMGLASFTQFLVPIPFLALSVFSGFVQAFVFMLLSMQFIAMAIDGATPEKPKEEMAPEMAT